MSRLCPSCGASAGDEARFCPSCGGPVPQAANAAGDDPYLGKTIAAKFYVQELLGVGGMGTVYKAQHLTLDKPVCLKLLRKTLLDDPSVVARFQREARASSRLTHPNAIQVIDFGQAEDGALFLAMEYLPGRDLQRVLVAEYPLAERRICHLMAQALAALGDAHAAGIIHRDLKPENIMVVPRRDDPDYVKVLDFGIAKLQDPSGGEGGPALTRAGLVCGTPEYMSPEQARGTALDARSDLYAIGVILYQLVTGYLPFEAATPIALVTKHLSEAPVPPRQRRPGAVVSEALEALILRCLAKDPDARPATAEALRAELLALEQASTGQPEDSPTATPAKTQLFAATPPPGLQITAVTPQAAKLQREVLQTPEPHADPAPPLPKQRSKTWIALAVVVALVSIGGVVAAIGTGSGARVDDSPAAPLHPPGSAGALTEKGKLLFAKGDFDQSLAYAREAIKADRKWAEAHKLLGMSYQAKNDAHRAVRAFRAYLKAAPTAADAGAIASLIEQLGG